MDAVDGVGVSTQKGQRSSEDWEKLYGFDPSREMLSVVASSFLLPATVQDRLKAQRSQLEFKTEQLQMILKVATFLINTKTLGDLDRAAKQYAALPEARDFPYQSFSEMISLVLVLLLRHLLQHSKGKRTFGSSVVSETPELESGAGLGFGGWGTHKTAGLVAQNCWTRQFVTRTESNENKYSVSTRC